MTPKQLREQVGRITAAVLPTEKRTRRVPHGGDSVEVDLQVAKRRSGGLAFYMRGTGPFIENRAMRRRAVTPTGSERRARMKRAERAARRNHGA